MKMKTVTRLGESKDAQHTEWQSGYQYAKSMRAKNKEASPKEEAAFTPAFRKGYRKGLTESIVSEGPMDFLRGAAGETGRKVANSGVGRAVGDVVQAGRTASAIGEFEKAVAQFAGILAQRDKLKAALGQVSAPDEEQQRQEPTMDTPAQAAPTQAAPAQPSKAPANATPDAFRTTQKPKGRMGQHGFEYTFNSFLQATHGERIDEGVWDFVKGAGGAIGGKVRDAINSYGDRPSMIKDIYTAGKKASAEGDLKAMHAKLAQAEAAAKAALTQLIMTAKGFGPKAQQAVQQAVAKLPREQQSRVGALLMKHVTA
jgi:hypothetical protein